MAEKGRDTTRADTNRRLKAERRRSDGEFARTTSKTDRQTDEVLLATRTQAKKRLATDRRRADEDTGKPSRSSAGPRKRQAAAGPRAVAEARKQEDEALRSSYVVADAVVVRERRRAARMLAAILSDERQATDRSLLLERMGADEAVAHRDDFLGMVSHDLRNELGAMNLYLAGVIGGVNDPDGDRKVLGVATTLQRSALRMGRLIGDLLDFASIEAGKFRVLPKDGDALRAIESVVELFQPIASAQQITLVAESVGRPRPACLDVERILQVLGNLVTNALKFTSPQGRVTVRAEWKAAETCFQVADTGSGIAKERIADLFDRNFQGPRSAGSGLGLGLYIAKHVVESHGGTIWVESSPGAGSTFSFTIPNDSNKKVQPPSPKPRHSRRDRERVATSGGSALSAGRTAG